MTISRNGENVRSDRTNQGEGKTPLPIETAVYAILGDETAHAIIADMGIQWAVVAAMAQATTADDPEALSTIRKWNAEQARASS